MVFAAVAVRGPSPEPRGPLGRHPEPATDTRQAPSDEAVKGKVLRSYTSRRCRCPAPPSPRARTRRASAGRPGKRPSVIAPRTVAGDPSGGFFAKPKAVRGSLPDVARLGRAAAARKANDPPAARAQSLWAPAA